MYYYRRYAFTHLTTQFKTTSRHTPHGSWSCRRSRRATLRRTAFLRTASRTCTRPVTTSRTRRRNDLDRPPWRAEFPVICNPVFRPLLMTEPVQPDSNTSQFHQVVQSRCDGKKHRRSWQCHPRAKVSQHNVLTVSSSNRRRHEPKSASTMYLQCHPPAAADTSRSQPAQCARCDPAEYCPVSRRDARNPFCVMN